MGPTRLARRTLPEEGSHFPPSVYLQIFSSSLQVLQPVSNHLLSFMSPVPMLPRAGSTLHLSPEQLHRSDQGSPSSASSRATEVAVVHYRYGFAHGNPHFTPLVSKNVYVGYWRNPGVMFAEGCSTRIRA